MSEEKSKHLFKKGSSGNPAGRPKGSLNKYTELSRELLSENGVLIVSKVIEKAMEGDVACLKMCMDRIIPAHKAVEIKHENQDMAINIVVESIGQAASNALTNQGYSVIDSRVGIVDAEVVESEDGDF
jgi:F420-0:gamma-glutamyl ligase